MTWEEAHESREDHPVNGTDWNESMASGKMHGRRVERVSKLLGRRRRPGDGGTSLVSEGRPCGSARPGPVDPDCAEDDHGTIVLDPPGTNNGIRTAVGSDGRLRRICRPRPPKTAPRA